VFDMQGNFRYKIGNIGPGPTEYINLTHVCHVPETDLLSVLDGPQKRVIYYTIDGKYQSSERTPFMLYYFEYLESGNKAYEVHALWDPVVGQYKENPLIVTDAKNHIMYGACHDYSSEKFNFNTNHPLRKMGKDVYYSPNFVDTIFLVQDTLVTDKYHINLKENRMPPFNQDMTNKKFEEYASKYFFFNGDFIELKDYTYINIFAPNSDPGVVYSHEKKETFICAGSGNHPFHSFLNTVPKAGFEDNNIVVDVQPYIILNLKDQLYREEKYKTLLDSLYEGLMEDANPVLFFYHLKID
jgi:hypothetical protein